MSGTHPAGLKALVFDVFGTVVDWRSSIIRELETFGRAKGISADWTRLADEWRGGYHPAMDRVRKGELPWTVLDALHPAETMLVAAHNNDLVAAQRQGLKAGFVARPTEYGPHQSRDFRAEHQFDVVARDFVQLAELLGA